jgi:GNAT superfamily N-acetyltransferase
VGLGRRHGSSLASRCYAACAALLNLPDHLLTRPAARGEIAAGDNRPMALSDLIQDAARGVFPAADGGWRRVPPWRPGLEAIVAFTGHAALAIADDVTDARLARLGVNGYGGAHDPRVIADLAGPGGWIDSLDLLMVLRGTGGKPRLVQPRLVQRPDLAGHPRVGFSRAVRDDPRIWGYPDTDCASLVVISTGIAGLTEIGFELDERLRGRGAGTTLVADALTVIPADRLVLAAVAPGNAASVRVLARSGFRPIGSVQLFRRAG